MEDLRQALEEFQALQANMPQRLHRHRYEHSSRWIRRDIDPRHRHKEFIPTYVTHYNPLRDMPLHEAQTTRLNLQAYIANNQGLPARFTSDEKHFVIDTGASITITNHKEDFVSVIRPVQPTTLKGIASGLDVKGVGEAEYVFKTDDGRLTTVFLKNVLYVPDCNVRLLCPRYLAENTGRHTDGFNSIRDVGIFTCNGHKITVPYHEGTGLPIITTATGMENFTKFCAALTLNDTKQTATMVPTCIAPIHFKHNLTPQQRIKLLLHERCNHKNMKVIN